MKEQNSYYREKYGGWGRTVLYWRVRTLKTLSKPLFFSLISCFLRVVDMISVFPEARRNADG